MSESTATGALAGRKLKFGFLLNLTLLGLLVLLWVILGFATENFATYTNITNLLRQASLWAIIAIGQTFVIITAGIDLSVGAVVGLASTVVALLLVQGWPIWAACLVTLLMGVLIGVAHGFAIVQMRLPPFITTLATLTALRGIGLLMTSGQTIAGLPSSFSAFSRESFLAVPNLFWMVLLVAAPCYLLLHHSRLGRHLFAVGSNREAARLSGVSVGRTIYLAYIVSAGLAALAGILTASRIGIGVATTGEGWELQSVASSVIGGASLFGAVGSVIGPLLGAILLTTINNGANLLNVNPFWQRIITGGLIVIIVYFDQLRRRGR
ncbi:monosaccharide ABC transporter membrane protein, CUT2 family [Arboricoccus pini]|uniref:Monosaccharide ABC transporter membrane protein, CUT2 family n=1 Tax=Arboricoccus pini TaxID=1963835 RepID=A0A212RZM3_9PROT|nr:monosaccharide ABC transporter membrane protein, CUT2 family [Arboricoccus pini]